MSFHVADPGAWFETLEVEPGLQLISEPGHICNWVIQGSERSVLLDTGLGLADIAAVAEPLARTPLTVVNSHTHFDHVGGNHQFAETAMHEAGPAAMAAYTSPEVLDGYAAVKEDLEPRWQRLVALDRESWFMIGPEQTVRPWPREELAKRPWRMDPPAPTRLLVDGDVLDLGDRELRVIHTPGHAPDHICLLEESSGILWAQDQAYYGPQLINLEGSDIDAFARSARRLADELVGSIRTVYTAHCLRWSVPPAFLAQLADGAEAVAAGDASMTRSEGLFREPVLCADFGHFKIYVRAEPSAP